MREATMTMMVTLIHKHRTWIDVLDAGMKEEFVILSGRDMMRGQHRTLRLVAKCNTRISRRGQIFSIPEFELSNAVRKLKSCPRFLSRYRKNAFLPEDVNEIVWVASHGIIEMELL